MFVTLISNMLDGDHTSRFREAYHSDAASCTSVTRVLVKAKIKVRGGAAYTLLSGAYIQRACLLPSTGGLANTVATGGLSMASAASAYNAASCT